MENMKNMEQMENKMCIFVMLDPSHVSDYALLLKLVKTCFYD